MIKLKNEKFNYVLTYYKKEDYGENKIKVEDNSDENNFPCFFTTKKRNIKKAFEELEKTYKNLTFNQIRELLDEKYKLDTYYYFMMD